MAVKCPHCQLNVELTPKLQGGPIYNERHILVYGSIEVSTNRVVSHVQPLLAHYEMKSSDYWIAICSACRREFVVRPYGTKPMWPLPETAVPVGVPETVAAAAVEAKKAHAVGAEMAALLAARTALIRIERNNSVSKLDDLIGLGKLTPMLAGQAHELRLWANVSGHEDVDPPAAEDVEELLVYLDILLDTLYVQPARLKELQNKRKNLRQG